MLNLLSSSLLFKNIKVQLYTRRTIILHYILRGCDTWSPTVSKKRRLRVFGNRVLRKIFGPTRDGVMESGEEDIIRHFMIYTHQICG